MSDDFETVNETKQQQKILNFRNRRSEAVLKSELEQLDKKKASSCNELNRSKKLFMVR